MNDRYKYFFSLELNKENTIEPTRYDGYLSIAFILFFIIVYRFYSLILFETGLGHFTRMLFDNALIVRAVNGLAITLILLLPIFIALKIRKQRLITIGLTSSKMPKNILYGVLFSLPFIIPTIVYSISTNRTITSYLNVLIYFIHQLINIALVEEIYFRGFLYTRLEAMVKSRIIRVIFCGIIFTFMHVPFQLIGVNTGFVEYILQYSHSLASLFIFAVYMSFVYSRTNNILVPTIVHALYNVAIDLFIY